MTDDNDESRVVTPEFRCSFLNVAKPLTKLKGKLLENPKYQVTMVFDKAEDLNPLKQLLVNAAKEKWGSISAAMIKKHVGAVFRDGSEKEHLAGFSDNIIFCNAKSQNKPGIVDKSSAIMMNPEADFKSGDYAKAQVTAYAYDVNGNKGVAFGLQHIQQTRIGEALGAGGGDPTKVFEAVETGADDPSNYEGDSEDDMYG